MIQWQYQNITGEYVYIYIHVYVYIHIYIRVVINDIEAFRQVVIGSPYARLEADIRLS